MHAQVGRVDLGRFAVLLDGRGAWWVAGGVAVLLWVAFSWPWLFGGQVIPWDAKDFYYPALRALAAAIHAGESGFWNPWLRAGSAAVIDPQSWLFTPTMRIVAQLWAEPTMRLVDTVELLHLLAGGLGVLALGRALGQRPPAALLGAIVFMFGGAAAARLQHTMMIVSYAYLPWCLLALRAGIFAGSTSRRVLAAAIAGLATASMAINRDQVAYINAVFLAVAALWWIGEIARREGRDVALRRLLGLAPALVIALFLIAIPALLTLDAVAGSTRNVLDFPTTARASLPPAAFFTTMMPNAYGSLDGAAYWGPGTMPWVGPSDVGIVNDGTTTYLYLGLVPIAALVLVAASRALRQRFAADNLLWLAGLAFAAVYVLGAFTPVFSVLYDMVPGLRLYRRPNDAVFLLNAMLALLSAGAADAFFRLPAGKQLLHGHTVAMLGGMAGLLFLAVFWFGSAFHHVGDVLPRLGICLAGVAAGVLAWSALPRFRSPFIAAAAIILVAAGDLIAHNSGSGLNARAETGIAAYRSEGAALAKEIKRLLKADDGHYRAEIFGLDRAPGFDGGGSWQNAAMVYGVEQTLGYDPLLKTEYASTVGAEQNSNAPVRRLTKLFTGYNSPLARLLGIRLVVTGRPINVVCPPFASAGLRLLAKRDGAYIYYNPGALPRVMVVGSAEPDSGGGLSEHPQDTVLISGLSTTERGTGTGAPGTARIRHHGSDHIEISADLQRPGWLVLNERFHPAWRAKVDGADTQVFRANRLFRAVRLSAGHHEIAFDFQPLRPEELWRIVRQRIIAGDERPSATNPG